MDADGKVGQMQGQLLMKRCLTGRICYGGLDLSSTTDITAFVLVFPPTEDDEHYYVLALLLAAGRNTALKSTP